MSIKPWTSVCSQCFDTMRKHTLPFRPVSTSKLKMQRKMLLRSASSVARYLHFRLSSSVEVGLLVVNNV